MALLFLELVDGSPVDFVALAALTKLPPVFAHSPKKHATGMFFYGSCPLGFDSVLLNSKKEAPYGASFPWSWWTESNPRPTDYKSVALPAELHQQI